MTAAITVETVSKRYRLGQAHTNLREAMSAVLPWHWGRRSPPPEIWALRNVSFSVEQGEALGVIGANGAGKTTLLRILSHVSYPTSGRVALRGRVSSLIELGAGFHPDLTGRENVYLNGAVLGLKRREIDALYERIVDFAGLEPFMDTPVKRYSSGMYCRLGFAVAAHVEPEILLIDEVLAVGDASFQYKCLERMRHLISEGRAVVFVSHNLDAVQHTCNRVLWLDHGRVALLGQPGDVVRAYMDSTDEQRTGRGIHLSVGSLLQIERVVFSSANGEETNRFEMGDDVVVSLYYRTERPVPKPHFTLGVKEEQSGTLFLASMLIDGQVPSQLDGRGVVRCRFRSVPLMPKVFQLWGEVRDQDRYAQIVPWQLLGTFRVVGSAPDNRPNAARTEEISIRHLRGDAPIHVPYDWEIE